MATRKTNTAIRWFALATAAAFALSPLGALADKGGKHGHGKGHGEHENRADGGPVAVEFHFGESDRHAVQEYYHSPARGQNCPPGLAKKGNGCMPPGQAKKWARGRPLPHDIIVNDLPGDLRHRLPPPPSGYRYVQLGTDVLMIAVGTSMVVDAIEDIVR